MRLFSKAFKKHIKKVNLKLYVLPILFTILVLGFLFLNQSLKNTFSSTVVKTSTPKQQTYSVQHVLNSDPKVDFEITDEIKWGKHEGILYLLRANELFTFKFKDKPAIHDTATSYEYNNINWQNTGIILKHNEDYRSIIYNAVKNSEDKIYLSVVHTSENEYWNSLYKLTLGENSNLSEVLNTNNMGVQAKWNAPFIKDFSPDNSTLLIELSCVDCESGLAEPHLVYSTSNNSYKILGPVNKFEWNQDGGFSYTLKPESCLEIVKSYSDFDNYYKCLEETPAEVITDKL